MTVTAKAVISEFYTRSAGHAYFVGCSAGGRQGLAEAQRYPRDYDGIIASAPAYAISRLQGVQIWVNRIGYPPVPGAGHESLFRRHRHDELRCRRRARRLGRDGKLTGQNRGVA